MKNFLICFLLVLLGSCASITSYQLPSNFELIGNSGGFIKIIARAESSGYLVKESGIDYEILGLPYVLESNEQEVLGLNVSIKAIDYGESRITIENNALVNLNIADQKRASSEALKVRQIVKNRSPQRDFNFDFVTPVKNFITSGYGKKRFINGSPRAPHLALDIDGFEGDPVVAPKPGKVVLAEEHFYSGKFMILDHGGGLFTSYSHLSAMAVDLGSEVNTGDLIGSIGSTGRVTGPHLHWVVYLNGNRINPELLVNLESY